MSARDDMQRIVVRIRAKDRAVFVGTAAEVQRSMTVGSEITGSPGQPVDTGALRASYIPEFIDDHTFQTSSGLPYAKPIEDGIGPHGPLTLRSSVGGFHSRKLTVAGIPAIVAHETRKARGNG
jgi:hypothetical protein